MERPLPTTPTCPRQITINAGEPKNSFSFAATQDDIDDDGESVMLSFDIPLPASVSEGSVAETIVAIEDDDTAGVTISETSLDIEEGDSDDLHGRPGLRAGR